MKPKKGQHIYVDIYGRKTAVVVIKVRSFGTLDVVRLSDGRGFSRFRLVVVKI